MKLLELAIQLKTVILFLAQIGPLLKRYDGKIKLYKSVSKLFYRYFLLAFRNRKDPCQNPGQDPPSQKIPCPLGKRLTRNVKYSAVA